MRKDNTRDNLQLTGINVELTRRCNLACAHCMRGESQDKAITKEIIDKLCHNLTTVIQLGIVGGEPLLEPDMLHYLIQKVCRIPHMLLLTITTNGTILTPSVIEDMEEFCMVKDTLFGNRKCTLAISKDPYHEADHDAAMAYYTALADKANKRIRTARGETEDSPPAINVTTNENAVNLLQYSGRAVNMVDDNREQYQLGKNLRTRSSTKHRIKIQDGLVKCSIGITVDGNVTIDDDGSWDEVDNSSIGNIQKHTLRHLIEQHNDQCLLTCTESLMFDLVDRIRIATDDEMPFIERLVKMFTSELAQSILIVRQETKKKYKMIPAYVIIDAINMPLNSFGIGEYAEAMAEASGNRDLQDLSDTLSGDLFDRLITYTQTATPDEYHQISIFAKALDYLRRNGDNFIRNKFAKYINLLKYDERGYCSSIIIGGTPPDNSKCYSCLEDGGDVFQDYGFWGYLNCGGEIPVTWIK